MGLMERLPQSGQLARLVHADCRPNVTASWNTVQLLGVPQEGKGQADLLRRLKVFGRKQSLPSSGVPVRAAGTRSRDKVGLCLHNLGRVQTRPTGKPKCTNAHVRHEPATTSNTQMCRRVATQL